MKRQKEYSIIIDTNVLKNVAYKNFLYFEPKKDLFDFATFLKKNNLKHIKLMVPKIVIEELKKHQIRAFNDSIRSLKSQFSKFKELPGFKMEIIDLEYEKHVKAKIRNFFSKWNIGIIDIPNKDMTPKLLQKALDGKKPFGGKGKGDSGFKDAIIWESILEYAINNEDENIIFWSNDTDFESEELLNEFQEATNKEITKYKNAAEIKVFLENEYKLKEKFGEIISKIDFSVMGKISNHLKEKYKWVHGGRELYDIIDIGIEGGVTNIVFNDKTDTYTVNLSMFIEFDSPESHYEQVDGNWYKYPEKIGNVAEIELKESDIDESLDVINVKAQNEEQLVPHFDFL